MKNTFVLIALCSGLWLGTPCAAAEEVIDKTLANGFLGKLKARDVLGASKFCDLVVSIDVGDAPDSMSMGGSSSSDFATSLAVKTTDSWIAETNYKKMAQFKDRRLYPLSAPSNASYAFFVVGDANDKLPGLSREYVQDTLKTSVKAFGWIVHAHKVQGSWLIYRVVPGGVVLE